MGRFILMAIVWIVGIFVCLGIILTGIVDWAGRGGHPLIVIAIAAVICLVISGLLGMRKERNQAADRD